MLKRWLGWIPEAAGRRRAAVLCGVGLITGLAALALPRLGLQAGIYELFPSRPGPISALGAFGRLFGGENELVVLVTAREPALLGRSVRRVARELSRSPLVEEVRAGVDGLSFGAALGGGLLLLVDDATWPAVKRRLEAPGPHVARLRRLLLSPLAPNLAAVARDPLGLTELILAGTDSDVDRQTGLWQSPDGRSALIFARTAGGRSENRRLHRALAALGARTRRQSGGVVGLQFTGAPVYAFHFERTLRRDLALSSTAALVAVIVVLLALFRSFRLLPLAGLVGGLAVCWTLAAAALVGGSLNLISLAFAALCIGMGMDALIHITATTREISGDPRSRVTGAIGALLPALLASTLTSIAAFLAFSLSAFAGLSQTGLLAATGLAFTLVLTLVLAPALAVPAPAVVGRLDRLLLALSGAVQRRRLVVVLLAAATGAGAVVAARALTFSADIGRLAPREFPPVQTDLDIARRFERQRDRLIVMLRGRRLESVLRANDRLAARLARLRADGRVAGYRSLAALLPSRATQQRRRARLERSAPEAAARLREALAAAGLRPGAFAPFLRGLEAPEPLTLDHLPESLRPLVRRHLRRDGSGAWVAATLVYPTRERLSRRALIGDAPPVGGVTEQLTGATLAGDQMAGLLRSDLVLICLVSLGVVLGVVSLLLRRPWPVAAALISLAWAGLVFSGALALLGQEVDLFNLMVLPLLIGYGVDDHIYVARRAVSQGTAAAVVRSGRAVAATTFTSVAAFGALLACDLPGLRRLGTTAMLGLVVALVGALVVMPALLGKSADRTDSIDRV